MTDSRPNVWQLQSRRNVPELVTALRHTDPEVRKRVALALRALDATQAVPALKEALRTEQDDQVRRHFDMTLHALDQRIDVETLIGAADVAGLIGALKSRRQDDIIRAAGALGDLQDHIAVEPLVILFHNPSSPPKVRLAAAEALLKLHSAPAVVTLLGALRRDSWQVRCNAAAVLGQIQATWAVEPLAQALSDVHPVVRRTAAAALRRIGSADAINALRARFTEQARGQAASRPASPKLEPRLKPRLDTPPLPKSLPEVVPTPPVVALPARKDDAALAPAAHSRVVSPKATTPAEVVETVTTVDTQPTKTHKPPSETQSGKSTVVEDDQSRPSRFRKSVDKLISFFSRDQTEADKS